MNELKNTYACKYLLISFKFYTIWKMDMNVNMNISIRTQTALVIRDYAHFYTIKRWNDNEQNILSKKCHLKKKSAWNAPSICACHCSVWRRPDVHLNRRQCKFKNVCLNSTKSFDNIKINSCCSVKSFAPMLMYICKEIQHQ